MTDSIITVGSWNVAKSALKAMEDNTSKWAKTALLREAHQLRAVIVKGIRDQAPGGKTFKPLSSWTLAMRMFPPPGQRKFSGTKALIRSGALVGSVTVAEKGEGIFVGVKRQTKNGMDMVNVAAVQEFGSKPIIVPFTDKMRRFFIAFVRRAFPYAPATGGGTGGSKKMVIVHRVPPRPFLQPSYDKWSVGLNKRLEESMKELIGKGIGNVGS